MRDNDKTDVLRRLDETDYIFVQRVSEDYVLEWVRPSQMRQRYGTKALVWPNIYFDGYFPDVQYIYLKDYGKLQGPLDDYHLRRVFNAHKAGLPKTTAVRMIEEGDATTDSNSFKASIEQLLSREQDADVIISDYVSALALKKRLFYTPNHPYNFVLVEMAERLASRASLFFDRTAVDVNRYKLDKVFIPVYPSIWRSQKLAFDDDPIFKGRAVEGLTESTVTLGSERLYNAVELVDEFYRLYNFVFRSRLREADAEG
jgi:hypothetical protein